MLCFSSLSIQQLFHLQWKELFLSQIPKTFNFAMFRYKTFLGGILMLHLEYIYDVNMFWLRHF